jgi:hypothetical protein
MPQDGPKKPRGRPSKSTLPPLANTADDATGSGAAATPAGLKSGSVKAGSVKSKGSAGKTQSAGGKGSGKGSDADSDFAVASEDIAGSESYEELDTDGEVINRDDSSSDDMSTGAYALLCAALRQICCMHSKTL